MCGGTHRHIYGDTWMEGLSPRVRGNRYGRPGCCGGSGSIPACAGEPDTVLAATGLLRVYPRVCGGTPSASRCDGSHTGLSPRVRGEPSRSGRSRPPPTVYPRVCGGTVRRPPLIHAATGLSPRVRGNRVGARGRRIRNRSIPACAGEPGARAAGETRNRVYPRVCGGTEVRPLGVGHQKGLSPRVRGNPRRFDGEDGPCGSIPACAGEPTTRTNFTDSRRVYPRVCGGTERRPRRPGGTAGLSPRVRGNQRLGADPVQQVGSIPACAGEPRPRARLNSLPRVYPRVCGGTEIHLAEIDGIEGLSPRVRGNPTRPAGRIFAARSIPACAGEPQSCPGAAAPGRVYPRVCGGTRGRRRPRILMRGLSPRVRGNRGRHVRGAGAHRSIPACAGEPGCGRTRRAPRWVYPRVCGGTYFDDQHDHQHQGLSPRVRGNRSFFRFSRSNSGSIPACAGEPVAPSRPGTPSGVYPRVCGGTPSPCSSRPRDMGLSPRVRGNRVSTPAKRVEAGSIPACAGEPGLNP